MSIFFIRVYLVAIANVFEFFKLLYKVDNNVVKIHKSELVIRDMKEQMIPLFEEIGYSIKSFFKDASRLVKVLSAKKSNSDKTIPRNLFELPLLADSSIL